MAMQELIDAIDDVRTKYEIAGMNENAEEFARLADFFRNMDEANTDDMKKGKKEVEWLISASDAARGLQDMCPVGVDYNAWCNSVFSLNKAACGAKKAIKA